ncbi:MAG: MFS transporter [Deltaproteobacteria bacterium]
MATENRRTYHLVIGSQYFLYFGVLGIFLPFFNLYCYHLGFSGFRIGILSAVRSVALVLFPLIWGALADRLNARRPIYVLCCFCSALIWMLYLFTADFWPMLAITGFYGIFFSPIISFLEAFTMDILGKEKNIQWRLLSFLSWPDH